MVYERLCTYTRHTRWAWARLLGAPWFYWGTGGVSSKMPSTCFKATPSQTRKLFSMERLDKCQLSKTLTEKQLACRYTFKNNYTTPMLFKTADPKSLPKHVHWCLGTGGTSCRPVRPAAAAWALGAGPAPEGLEEGDAPLHPSYRWPEPVPTGTLCWLLWDLPGSRVITNQAFPTLPRLELLT